MNKKRPILLPKHERMLQQVGEQLKLARLRRKLSAEQISQRADIGASTLWRIEKGGPGVAIRNYFHVLTSLGLAKDILKLASDDELGRKIQDAGLITKKEPRKEEINRNDRTLKGCKLNISKREFEQMSPALLPYM